MITPGDPGDFFLTVESLGLDDPTQYRVEVQRDEFVNLTSAVELFSTVSAETNGAFIVRDDVNFGSTTGFEAAIFNALVSSLGPVVLTANPQQAPRGLTLTISLSGARTDWRVGTTVEFEDPAIQVLGVDVRSSVQLDAEVTIGEGASLEFADVTVRTSLDEEQIARGRDVLEVVPAPDSSGAWSRFSLSRSLRGRRSKPSSKGF